MPSWRSMTNEPFWLQHDAVIAVDDTNRGNLYEVWVDGTQIGRRYSLREAKALVEDVHGALKWTRETLEPVVFDHPAFGPTTEFTEPQTIYWADIQE